MIQTLLVIFFSSARSVYFNNCVHSLHLNFVILDHTKSCVAKMHSIAVELVRHAHKLDMKLRSLCGNGFSLFAVSMLAKPYYI